MYILHLCFDRQHFFFTATSSSPISSSHSPKKALAHIGMSLSEQAAERLRQCIFELTPTLLAALTDLRQAHPQQLLLPFNQVREALALFIDKPDVKEAFGLVDNLSTAAKDGTEVRIRNLCLEISNNELRKVVLEDSTGLSAGGEPTDVAFASTFNRLDIILALSLQDLIDPTLPLSLVEELIESQPISTCSRLFGYTESRVKPLTIDLHPTRGKGLVLLRTCNELLRRLSKPSQQHTVFAGRILSLLASVFPLGERSGVNLRGDFNVENKTIIEDRQDDEAEATDALADKDERDQIFKVDYEFYELFWKVQRFFSNPPLLMTGPDSSRLQQGTARLHLLQMQVKERMRILLPKARRGLWRSCASAHARFSSCLEP